jgi:alanyl-tRNA synthetase
MATEKLYWTDPFATSFTASRATTARFGERASLVLDRTIFYPEAGGQLSDVGTLDVGGTRFVIDDVQVDDDGTIHHLSRDLDAAPASVTRDGEVHGAIDRARRRDHMAQHTAQHALSRALLDVARAETVSSRLGATACTIDVHLAEVADADLARAEDLVNAIVMDDVPVRALFPNGEELARMELRRAPKVSTNVRVIEIDGFDLSPCGGTHCTQSGQIGVVRVVGTERYKGKLRVTFHAGRRAIEDARAKERVLAALAGELTCGVLDVGAAVGKLRGDLKSRADALSAMRGELVELVADRVWRAHPPDPGGTTIACVVRPRDDVGMLRTLAGRLASRADIVAVCASPDPASADGRDHLVVAQRGAAASFDCGAWLKAVAARNGGRGGGRPERAEGKLRIDGARGAGASADPADDAREMSAALAALVRA